MLHHIFMSNKAGTLDKADIDSQFCAVEHKLTQLTLLLSKTARAQGCPSFQRSAASMLHLFNIDQLQGLYLIIFDLSLWLEAENDDRIAEAGGQNSCLRSVSYSHNLPTEYRQKHSFIEHLCHSCHSCNQSYVGQCAQLMRKPFCHLPTQIHLASNILINKRPTISNKQNRYAPWLFIFVHRLKIVPQESLTFWICNLTWWQTRRSTFVDICIIDVFVANRISHWTFVFVAKFRPVRCIVMHRKAVCFWSLDCLSFHEIIQCSDAHNPIKNGTAA